MNDQLLPGELEKRLKMAEFHNKAEPWMKKLKNMMGHMRKDGCRIQPTFRLIMSPLETGEVLMQCEGVDYNIVPCSKTPPTPPPAKEEKPKK